MESSVPSKIVASSQHDPEMESSEYQCQHCDSLAERGIRTTPPPYHGPDTDPRHFAITDWSGIITRFEHSFHAGPADMGEPGPYYLVAMADGALVYSEAELSLA